MTPQPTNIHTKWQTRLTGRKLTFTLIPTRLYFLVIIISTPAEPSAAPVHSVLRSSCIIERKESSPGGVTEQNLESLKSQVGRTVKSNGRQCHSCVTPCVAVGTVVIL